MTLINRIAGDSKALSLNGDALEPSSGADLELL
jgi:hypothetical protein